MFHKELFFIILFAAITPFAFAQDTKPPVLQLNSRALTLKSVFDAGLRPRVVPSLEIILCEVANEDLAISVDGRQPIHISAEWINFDINADDEVTTFQARDRNFYTLDEVLAIAKKHLQILGIDTAKLDDWEATERNGMKVAAKAGSPFMGVRTFTGGGWFGDRNMKAGIKIMPTFRVQAPFTLQYYAQWISTSTMKKLRRVPITPPAGYEHVSMEPYSSKKNREKEGEANPSESPPLSTEKQKQSAHTSRKWLFFVLIAIVIVGIIVILVRARKKQR